jgi:hypothetical protein
MNGHQKYLTKLFNHIEKSGYTFECECEGEEITKDEALTQVDDTHIYIIDKNEHSLGWIYWTFWNDWDESISDYTLDFDKILDLDNWISKTIKEVQFV